MNGEEILFLYVALSLLSGFETTSINHDFLDCLLHVTAAGVFFRQFYFLCLLINLIRVCCRVGIFCVACLCLLKYLISFYSLTDLIPCSFFLSWLKNYFSVLIFSTSHSFPNLTSSEGLSS